MYEIQELSRTDTVFKHFQGLDFCQKMRALAILSLRSENRAQRACCACIVSRLDGRRRTTDWQICALHTAIVSPIRRIMCPARPSVLLHWRA